MLRYRWNPVLKRVEVIGDGYIWVASAHLNLDAVKNHYPIVSWYRTWCEDAQEF